MENFFVYFYSKKNPSEFLVEQRVKSNEQQAKSNDQRVKSNVQNVTSNDQNITSNEPKGMKNKQKVTSNKQKVTSNEQKVTSNEQRAKRSTSEKSKEGYSLKVDIQYPKNLHNVQNDLLFLPERIKIEKVEKLVANLRDNNE